MPKDEFGNSADVVMYGRAIPARMAAGGEVERYVNASARDVVSRVIQLMSVGDQSSAVELLDDYYQAISPETREAVEDSMKVNGGPEAHLKSLAEHGPYLKIAPDNTYINPKTLRDIENRFPPNRSKITFWNYNRWVTTVSEMLIGSCDMIFLDKSSFKPMSICTSRLQHHGLPAPNNKTTKSSRPTLFQGPRVFAESELRQISQETGLEPIRDIMDLALCPEATHDAVRLMYKSDHPMLERIYIDREKIPYGSDRPTSYARHINSCGGTRIYVPKASEIKRHRG